MIELMFEVMLFIYKQYVIINKIKVNLWITKVGIHGGSTKVASQYLSETITKLNKIFIIDLDWNKIKINHWIPKVGIHKDGTKVTPQYLSETITKLNKFFYYRFRLNRYNF